MLKKIQTSQINFSFMRIRMKATRSKKLEILTNKLMHSFESFLNNSIYKVFWSVFLQQNSSKKYRFLALENILLLDRKRIQRIQK